MKAVIVEKLQQLEDYVAFIDNYKVGVTELSEDDVVRSALERNVQLALETVLDICQMIIAEENMQRPETHSEAVEILAKNDVLDAAFAERLAPALGFRNILVHKYEDIDLQKLHDFLQRTADFETFSQQIAQYLKKKQ